MVSRIFVIFGIGAGVCMFAGCKSPSAAETKMPVKYALYPAWGADSLKQGEAIDQLRFQLLLSCDVPVFVEICHSLDPVAEGRLRVEEIEVSAPQGPTGKPESISKSTIPLTSIWKPEIVNFQPLLFVTVDMRLFEQELSNSLRNGNLTVRLKTKAYVYDGTDRKLKNAQPLYSTPFSVSMKEGKMLRAVLMPESYDTEPRGGLKPTDNFDRSPTSFLE